MAGANGCSKGRGDSGSRGKQQQVMPADCRPIEGAVDPATGKKSLTLYVRNSTIDITARKGMGHARQLAFTVVETVQNPTGIYRGVTDDDFEEGDESWLIYGAVPPRAYDLKTGQAVSAWKGEVFLVFVDEDLVIRRWKWTNADPNNPRRPIDHNNGRFLETLI